MTDGCPRADAIPVHRSPSRIVHSAAWLSSGCQPGGRLAKDGSQQPRHRERHRHKALPQQRPTRRRPAAHCFSVVPSAVPVAQQFEPEISVSRRLDMLGVGRRSGWPSCSNPSGTSQRCRFPLRSTPPARRRLDRDSRRAGPTEGVTASELWFVTGASCALSGAAPTSSTAPRAATCAQASMPHWRSSPTGGLR